MRILLLVLRKWCSLFPGKYSCISGSILYIFGIYVFGSVALSLYNREHAIHRSPASDLSDSRYQGEEIDIKVFLQDDWTMHLDRFLNSGSKNQFYAFDFNSLVKILQESHQKGYRVRNLSLSSHGNAKAFMVGNKVVNYKGIDKVEGFESLSNISKYFIDSEKNPSIIFESCRVGKAKELLQKIAKKTGLRVVGFTNLQNVLISGHSGQITICLPSGSCNTSDPNFETKADDFAQRYAMYPTYGMMAFVVLTIIRTLVKVFLRRISSRV